MSRADILDRVRRRGAPWDIIVIGGGATGAGCAVDAASRGYDVLLLEQHDFGKGTSSRSTKLVHGGVRYLAQGNVSLVREALRERGLLLKNAPHVVHKLSFVVPCYSRRQKIFYGTGLKIYDLLSGKYSFGKSRMISRAETLERLPNLRSEGLSGGILYYDGQFDDARLLIDLVQSACSHGAAALNYSKVKSLTKNASGKLTGLTFDDVETGETIGVSAVVVINATGAFCDSVREMANAEKEHLVTFSQGIHLVFDRKFLPSDEALMIPKTADGRVLFCIPWLGALLVGTTDSAIDRAELEPKALENEIEFIFKTIQEYLSPAPTRADILSIFAGIRPLVRSGRSKNTASLSRGHTIEIDPSGLLTITGGKWTTYRHMAEDAVDQAIRAAGLPTKASISADLEITDSDAAEMPMGERLHPDLPVAASDIVRAIRQEFALHLEDVLARRTRALFLNAHAAIKIAPQVARIMAEEFGKDELWIAAEVATFNKVAANYLAG